jgi:hypothetical protein
LVFMPSCEAIIIAPITSIVCAPPHGPWASLEVTTIEEFIDPLAETNGAGRLSSPIEAAYVFWDRPLKHSRSVETATIAKNRIFLTLARMTDRVTLMMLSSGLRAWCNHNVTI